MLLCISLMGMIALVCFNKLWSMGSDSVPLIWRSSLKAMNIVTIYRKRDWLEPLRVARKRTAFNFNEYIKCSLG